MYCSKCGSEIHDEAVVCPKCGCQTQNTSTVSTNTDNVEQEKAKGGMIALSILLPIVGIILGIVQLCKKQTKAGTTYLLCGIITWVVFAALYSMM